MPWGHPPHLIKLFDIFYYLPHHNSPTYGLSDIKELVSREGNWLREKKVTDDNFNDFIELVDIGLKHEGILFSRPKQPRPTKAQLRFVDIGQSSFALFYLHSGLNYAFEEFLFRASRLDTLGFIGFILSYDLGIIRWRVIFFYLRSM